MENQFQMNEEGLRKMEKSHRRGKIIGGLLVITAGVLFMAKELGAELPFWIFSWKTLLIALGIVSAVKHKFANGFWFFAVLIGSVFLLGDVYPEVQIKPFLWPSLVILIGLTMLFKPRRKSDQFHRCSNKWQRRYYNRATNPLNPSEAAEMTKDDFIESTVFMAAVKKNIISKHFKGGEITNVFGGSELNLMQADFESRIGLEITQVFGGTKLIVPANWEIRSELVTVFGNVDDKRPISPNNAEANQKVLMLTGTTVFGGIEIKSY